MLARAEEQLHRFILAAVAEDAEVLGTFQRSPSGILRGAQTSPWTACNDTARVQETTRQSAQIPHTSHLDRRRGFGLLVSRAIFLVNSFLVEFQHVFEIRIAKEPEE